MLRWGREKRCEIWYLKYVCKGLKNPSEHAPVFIKHTQALLFKHLQPFEWHFLFFHLYTILIYLA